MYDKWEWEWKMKGSMYTSDIKCEGTGCKEKDKCHRHVKPDNPFWQGYQRFFDNLQAGHTKCYFFIPIPNENT